MTLITLRVIEGSDRGKIFGDLPTPVTIGREEGNTIQLNDERVSRFHVKIQDDHERVVLTDLESTNGTKVNGEDIQLRILRFGDQIMVGRSILIYGSREQIAERLARLRNGIKESEGTLSPSELLKNDAVSLDFEVNWSADPDMQATLHMLEPPELPERLTPGQAAQLAEVIEYFHIRLRNLMLTVRENEQGERMTLDASKWQNLLDIQARLSEYLRQIGDPDQHEI